MIKLLACRDQMRMMANYIQFKKVVVQTLKLLQFIVFISSVLYLCMVLIMFSCCEQFGVSCDDVLTTHYSVNSKKSPLVPSARQFNNVHCDSTKNVCNQMQFCTVYYFPKSNQKMEKHIKKYN